MPFHLDPSSASASGFIDPPPPIPALDPREPPPCLTTIPTHTSNSLQGRRRRRVSSSGGAGAVPSGAAITGGPGAGGVAASQGMRTPSRRTSPMSSRSASPAHPHVSQSPSLTAVAVAAVGAASSPALAPTPLASFPPPSSSSYPGLAADVPTTAGVAARIVRPHPQYPSSSLPSRPVESHTVTTTTTTTNTAAPKPSFISPSRSLAVSPSMSSSFTFHQQPSASESDGAIFERDVEEIERSMTMSIPGGAARGRGGGAEVKGLNTASPSPPTSGGSDLLTPNTTFGGRIPHHGYAHHHHVMTHDSSDNKVPTVLDDAIEALTAELNRPGRGMVEVEMPVALGAGGAAGVFHSGISSAAAFAPLAGADSIDPSSLTPPRTQNTGTTSPTTPFIALDKPAAVESPQEPTRPAFIDRQSSNGPVFPGAFPVSQPVDHAAPEEEHTNNLTSPRDHGPEENFDAAAAGPNSPTIPPDQSTRSWKTKIDDWISPKPTALLDFAEAKTEVQTAVDVGDAQERPNIVPVQNDGLRRYKSEEKVVDSSSGGLGIPKPDNLISAQTSPSSSPPALSPYNSGYTGPTHTSTSTGIGTGTGKERRRISFVAYNDILSQLPLAVNSLSELTNGQTEPDHLPGTVSPGPGPSRNRSPYGTFRRSSVKPREVSSSVSSGNGAAGAGASHSIPMSAEPPMQGPTRSPASPAAAGKRVSIPNLPTATKAQSVQAPGLEGHRSRMSLAPGSSMVEDDSFVGVGVGGGGEWEREGLGQGLAQRLEMLAAFEKMG